MSDSYTENRMADSGVRNLIDRMAEMERKLRPSVTQPGLIEMDGKIHGMIRGKTLTCSSDLLKLLEGWCEPVRATPAKMYAGLAVQVSERFPCTIIDFSLDELRDFVNPDLLRCPLLPGLEV